MSKTRKNSSRLLAVFLAFTLLLAACGGSGGSEPAGEGDGGSGGEGSAATATPAVPMGAGLCANPYFPAITGAQWTYLATGGPSGDFSYTNSISAADADSFTLSTQFDDLTVTQEWACTAEGLAALQFAPGPEASLSGAGISATYETTAASGVTVPASLAPGSTWTQSFDVAVQMMMPEGMNASGGGTITQNYTAVGTETVSTAAGSFEAMKVDSTLHFDLTVDVLGVSVPVVLDSTGSTWWAPGVGLVKSDTSATINSGEAIVSNADLQSYAIP
jgi:hypothetical protein